MRSLTTCVVLAVAMAIAFAAPTKPVPSSRLKAYAGPEGEVIALVEANDGKQMLVHFKSVDGLDGKTLLYDYEDLGDHGKTVFITKKRGSKTYRSILLTQSNGGGWSFTHPDKPGIHFDLAYSDEASKKIKVDDVLAAYKP
jgi:hypothetical protein